MYDFLSKKNKDTRTYVLIPLYLNFQYLVQVSEATKQSDS